ncbi:MAG: TonB-dependent receptor [Candidatus Omnitrophica bacterium]|nr:TonB-dependent receptor [Candidatus Omnitrophota bacterium]
MKKIICILVMCILAANTTLANEGKGASILGKTLDEALSPLDILLQPSQRLDPIVVTPTRYRDPSINVNANITVIDAQEIANSHERYVPDILRKEAGVLVSDFLGNGKALRVDMRGFGDSATSNVLVLVNGRRTNQIDLSGADWAQINPDAIERIEVVRGPQSTLYGDNAVGGVINIITKTGKGKKPEIRFKYETGSYRHSSFSGSIEGGSDFLDYFGSASTLYTNGYRINNHLETVDYDVNLSLKPTEDVTLHLNGSYHKDWYGLAAAVKPEDINLIGRRGSKEPDSRARTEDAYLMLTPEISYTFGFGEVLFSSDISVRGRRTRSVNVYSFGNWINAHHIKSFGVTPKLAFTTNFFNIGNRVLAGLDLYTHTDEINGGSEGGLLFGNPDLVVIHKDSLGLYLTDTLELPLNLILNGGIRTEWTKFKFDQQEQVALGGRKTPFEYAYDVGLTFKYNEKSSIYATHSRFFRLPVTDEWFETAYYWDGVIEGGLNTDLKPQVGFNYEVGIKDNSSKYIGFQADYYIMDIKHELYYNPLPSITKNSVYHHTIHHGLEITANTFLFEMIHGFANYAYQKAFFVGDDFAGNEIPLAPKHQFSAGINYNFIDKVHLGYIANYIGERWFINDLKNDQPKLKPYLTHNIKLSYKDFGWEIFAALNNISDEEYSEYGSLDSTLTKPGYYPSPRRNFLIGVSCRF